MATDTDGRSEPGDGEDPVAYASTNRKLIASAPSWFVPPPYGWRHPVSGRFGWQPDPALIAFGQYLKRARYLAGLTQHELARRSTVDQGLISRLERALAPATKVDRLVKLSDVLGRSLPLGYCPHEHWCKWQPAPPPPPDPPVDGLSDALRAALTEAGMIPARPPSSEDDGGG